MRSLHGGSRAAWVCKGNYAANVKEIMPNGLAASNLRATFYERKLLYFAACLRRLWLDSHVSVGIITLTLMPAHPGGCHERTHGRQKDRPAPAWRTQQAARQSKRSLVPGQ